MLCALQPSSRGGCRGGCRVVLVGASLSRGGCECILRSRGGLLRSCRCVARRSAAAGRGPRDRSARTRADAVCRGGGSVWFGGANDENDERTSPLSHESPRARTLSFGGARRTNDETSRARPRCATRSTTPATRRRRRRQRLFGRRPPEHRLLSDGSRQAKRSRSGSFRRHQPCI